MCCPMLKSMTPTILLIEDDPGIAGSLKKVLMADGYDVHTASRGDDGLEQAKRSAYAVVITDLRMPGMNGLELVEADRIRVALHEIHHRGAVQADVLLADAQAFRQVVREGARTLMGMPHYSELTDEQLLALRHYIRSVAETVGQEAAEMRGGQ